MKHLITSTLIIAGASLLVTGCATQGPTRVTTGGPGALTSMGLDMADLMDAASQATSELLVHRSISDFEARNGRQPRINVGSIINSTRERINIEQVSERVMDELLNSGQVTVVASDAGVVRSNELRAFLDDKKINLSGEADFYLEGTILQQITRQGGLQENTFTFQLRLNDSATRSRLWSRNIDITKRGASTNRRGSVGW